MCAVAHAKERRVWLPAAENAIREHSSGANDYVKPVETGMIHCHAKQHPPIAASTLAPPLQVPPATLF